MCNKYDGIRVRKVGGLYRATVALSHTYLAQPTRKAALEFAYANPVQRIVTGPRLYTEPKGYWAFEIRYKERPKRKGAKWKEAVINDSIAVASRIEARQALVRVQSDLAREGAEIVRGFTYWQNI